MRCWYTRWQMSNALDDAALASRMAGGHVARCAACRGFGASIAALHTQLSRDAHLAAAPAPLAPRARSRWLLAGPLAAGVAALIAIRLGSSGPPPAPVAPPPAASQQALLDVRGLAARVTQAVAQTALQAELDNLAHDGRRGLDAVLATGGLRPAE